jgi:2-polyprenyl-6-methoxyphenol hydroxylase-like FAD-dependent oxidoreductase
MADATVSSQPLKVLVVGAGIGGLSAALGLRQQGHEVTLFERSQLAQETGAAIHLAPNCHSILRRFGVLPEVFGANPVNGVTEYDAEGNLKFDLDLRKPLSIWQHPWVLSHRVRLHEELKRKALSTDDEGTPAVLKTSSVVTTVDPDTGTVTLEDGSSFSGDLVLGADGVSVSLSTYFRRYITQLTYQLTSPSPSHVASLPDRTSSLSVRARVPLGSSFLSTRSVRIR